jgi:hypothetical protein
LFIHIITAASTTRNQPAGATKAAPRDPTVMMRLAIFYEKNKFFEVTRIVHPHHHGATTTIPSRGGVVPFPQRERRHITKVL